MWQAGDAAVERQNVGGYYFDLFTPPESESETEQNCCWAQNWYRPRVWDWVRSRAHWFRASSVNRLHSICDIQARSAMTNDKCNRLALLATSCFRFRGVKTMNTKLKAEYFSKFYIRLINSLVDEQFLQHYIYIYAYLNLWPNS